MHFLQKSVLTFLLAITASFIVNAAHADTVDDMAYILDKLDETGANPFKINGNDLRASREFFYCMDDASGDVEFALCVDNMHNTPLGQKVADDSGIPSWFWDLLDAYIDLRNEDYWALVGDLGEAAICIVAQVLSSGTDICGLIQDIVEVAEDVWEAAKDVAGFLESVGEETAEVIEDAACEIGIGSCGGSSPPEEIVYAWIFAPKITDGIYARESVSDQAFDTLTTNLSNNAKHNPVIWSKPELNRLLGNQSPYPDHVVNYAKAVFTKVVDAQWSANVAQDALPKLASKRNDYDRDPYYTYAANDAAVKFIAYRTAPGLTVSNTCVDDFKRKFGFAHVDRWIAMYPQQAAALSKVQTNSSWCFNNFWGKNKNEFAPHFYESVRLHFCPEKNGQLQCPTTKDMEACADFLGSVNQANKCKASLELSTYAAKKIDEYFKQKGSKLPCKIREKKSAYPQVEYECTRPAQQYHCGRAHNLYFGTYPNPLLRCTLDTPSNYEKLIKTADKEIKKINSKYNWKLIGNPLDPLAYINGPESSITAVPDDMKEELEKKRNFSAPSSAKGFVLQEIIYSKRSDPVIPKIDGEDTPVIYFYRKNAVEKLRALTKGLEKKFNLPGSGPLENALTNPFSNPIDVQQLQNEKVINIDKDKVKGINDKQIR